MRIIVIALGPVVLNGAILIVTFFVSLCFGPMLNTSCTSFGSVMAGIAHATAEIVILVEQEDRRIEATERQKQLPPDQQAGTGQERQAGVAPGHRHRTAAVEMIRREQRARL